MFLPTRQGSIGNFTVYVNPYVVVRNSSMVTKHFYIGSQRVVTKLTNSSDGLLQDQAGGSDTKTVDYTNKKKQSKAGIKKSYSDLGLDVAFEGEAGKSGQTPPNGWGLGNGNNGGGKPSDPGNNNGGGNNNKTEAYEYYYHPDHLGSSSYITDANGEVSQHMEYFAFGETFIEEHSNTDRTPYLFNGKELDEETGLYYYSARYYDARTSIWQSVDPLAEERPGMSPYNFVQNNPILRVDPDGRKDIIYDHEGNQTGVENDNWLHNFFYGERNYIMDDGGENRFRLGEQGLAVMKSENFEGFVSDWETSTSEDGLNAKIKAATKDYNPMKENVLNYALRESKDGEKMDQKMYLNPNKIYGFAGKALNTNEAGNVVWGAAMDVLGMDPFGTYLSAHGGTLMLRGRFDERDESSAALMGSFYMQNSQSGRNLKKALSRQIYGEWIKKNYGLTPR